MIADNDLLSIQQARILAENAREAQAKLAAFPQETLDAGVECLAKAIVPHIRELALMSQEETGYGNPADKEFKNRFVCEQLPERLRGMRCVGVLNDAADGRIVEVGVPLGVIVALCPVTSPVSTAIYKTLLAVKSGNAIIFSPHPGATKSITRALEILSAAAVSCGLPEGCVSHLRTVTKSGTLELMGHPATSLLMITGVPGMFREARCLGKPRVQIAPPHELHAQRVFAQTVAAHFVIRVQMSARADSQFLKFQHSILTFSRSFLLPRR